MFQNALLKFVVDEKALTLTTETKQVVQLPSRPTMYYGFENEWIVCEEEIIHCTGKPRFEFSRDTFERVTRGGVTYPIDEKRYFNNTELPDLVFPCYFESFFKVDRDKNEFRFCDIKGDTKEKPISKPPTAAVHPLRKDEYILVYPEYIELISNIKGKNKKFKGSLLYVGDDLIITSQERHRFKDKWISEEYSITFVPGSHVYLSDRRSYAYKK